MKQILIATLMLFCPWGQLCTQPSSVLQKKYSGDLKLNSKIELRNFQVPVHTSEKRSIGGGTTLGTEDWIQLRIIKIF